MTRDVFIYGARLGSPDAERITAVYSPDPFAADSILPALKAHFDHSIPPEAIMLLGGRRCESRLHQILSDQRLLTSLPLFTRTKHPPGVFAFHQTALGEWAPTNEASKRYEISLRSILQTGLAHIFKERGGLLECTSSFHYRKPSGAHCNSFVRTANVLVHGEEISFIASQLVPFLQNKPRYIYTDTAAINSVVYAALLLVWGPEDPIPNITSFGSYAGLPAQQFAAKSLVVISASTSGHLEAKLVADKYLDRSQIVTLFYLGERDPDGNVICNLRQHDFQPIKNEDPMSCSWCRKDIPLIALTDEQFVPENPHVHEEFLKAKDEPSWLADFLENIVGTASVYCNRRTEAGTAQPWREMFLSTAQFNSESSNAGRRLETALHRVLPASLKRIIHLGDEESERLAETIGEYAKRVLRADHIPTIISARALEQQQELKDFDGSTLVVGGAIASGRTVLAVSQLLRPRLLDKAVHYLVAIARTQNHRRLRDLKSNLTYSDGPGGFDVHVLGAIFLPEDSPLRLNPWQQELSFLIDVQNSRTDLTAVDQLILNARIDELGNPNGLQNNLFWPRNDGQALELDPTFAFWDFDYSLERINQADVYLTMAAVLHNRREGTEGRGGWLQHEHHRVVLSPLNFARFNDGVIQASLLRAARIEELDYTVRQQLSATMRGYLETVVQYPDRPSAEALAEFLLAIAMQRLRLHPSDLQRLHELLTKVELSPKLALLRRITGS